MTTPSFDASRPVKATKDIPCGGGKVIPKGAIWNWRAAGTDEVRVERLFNTGWLRHTDAAPSRAVRKAEKARVARGKAEKAPRSRGKAAPKVVSKPVRASARVVDDEDTRVPLRPPVDNFVEVL